jgi:hypothetical protein
MVIEGQCRRGRPSCSGQRRWHDGEEWGGGGSVMVGRSGGGTEWLMSGISHGFSPLPLFVMIFVLL